MSLPAFQAPAWHRKASLGSRQCVVGSSRQPSYSQLSTGENQHEWVKTCSCHRLQLLYESALNLWNRHSLSVSILCTSQCFFLHNGNRHPSPVPCLQREEIMTIWPSATFFHTCQLSVVWNGEGPKQACRDQSSKTLSCVQEGYFLYSTPLPVLKRLLFLPMIYSGYHICAQHFCNNCGSDCTSIDYCPPGLRRTTCQLVQTMMFTVIVKRRVGGTNLAAAKHFPVI